MKDIPRIKPAFDESVTIPRVPVLLIACVCVCVMVKECAECDIIATHLMPNTRLVYFISQYQCQNEKKENVL